MQKGRVSLHVATKDRHSELFGLLQSLRTQSFKEFDIIIVDDSSGTPVISCQFLSAIITRMKLEGHKFKIIRNEQSFGCCYARNKCIDEDDFDNEYTCRLDDDILLESDYIEKLLEGIDSGYDMVTGVVPLLAQPELIRETKFVKPIMNMKEFDKDGNIVKYGDDCACCYIESEIIPIDEFRTNCLYLSEINKKVRYEDNLSTVSFREEGFFSTRAILEGYKIGCHTGAVCWHLQCLSGGNRRPDYNECVTIDNETFYKWMKQNFIKHGNFLEEYHKNGNFKTQKTI